MQTVKPVQQGFGLSQRVSKRLVIRIGWIVPPWIGGHDAIMGVVVIECRHVGRLRSTIQPIAEEDRLRNLRRSAESISDLYSVVVGESEHHDVLAAGWTGVRFTNHLAALAVVILDFVAERVCYNQQAIVGIV